MIFHYPAETPNTITSRAELLADLDRVRDTGVAYYREESTVGISAVGAEIRDSGGIVAALSIPVSTARFADQEERLVEMLLATCAEVSASLGANGHTGPEPSLSKFAARQRECGQRQAL